MGGVDLADQRIAYYHPNLRCRRNWMPMFLQIVSIVRSNSYIVYKDFKKKKAISHKSFTMATINALMKEAHATYVGPIRTSPKKKQSSPKPEPSTSPKLKRNRKSTNVTMRSLFDEFPTRTTDLSEHLPSSVGYKKRGPCVWCQILFQESKKTGEVVQWQHEIKRTSKICAKCTFNSPNGTTCFLCSEHFNVFHDSH